MTAAQRLPPAARHRRHTHSGLAASGLLNGKLPTPPPLGDSTNGGLRALSAGQGLDGDRMGESGAGGTFAGSRWETD